MAAERIITKGATDVFLTVSMRSSSTGQLVGSIAYGTPVVKYQRDGVATATTVTLVDGTLGTHLDSSWKETQVSGEYQLCLADAAFATGANGVTVTVTSTGCIDKTISVALVDFNLFSAAPNVNTYTVTNNAITAAAIADDAIDAAAIKDDAVAKVQAGLASQTSVDTIDGIVDTLVARVLGTIAAGTHNPQSGDAFARLGSPAGASHAADVAAVKAETAAIAGKVVDKATLTDTRIAKLDNLDTTVGSRLASTGYTAPDNASAAAAASSAATAASKATSAEAVTAKLDTAMVQDGAVYKFTTNALEQAPAGEGGTTTIVLGPLVAVRYPANTLPDSVALEMLAGESKTFLLTVLDANDAVVNLSALTLRFVVQTRDAVTPTGVFDVEDAAITRTGTSSEIANVAVTGTTSTGKAGLYDWWLLSVITGGVQVLQRGTITVYPGVVNMT